MDRLMLFKLRKSDKEDEPQTQSIIDQITTEQSVQKAYYEKLSKWKDDALELYKLNHIGFANKRLTNLSTEYESLDASQPWLVYWLFHTLQLLNCSIPDERKLDIMHFIKSTQHPDGGFGGGPYQSSHLAPTYAAVNALVLLCRQDALDIINRDTLLNWLTSLRQSDGSFVMHIGGELDVRGAYCAASVMKLTGLLDKHPRFLERTAKWVASCQTYEGGFGSQPGSEAHGGYTFCGIATLSLLNKLNLIDLPRAMHWATHRQMATEGGFQGRTNKLVDSCYSFWQGAIFPIVEHYLWKSNCPFVTETETLFNPSALQEYILLCCQKVSYTRPGLSVPIRDNRSHVDDENEECVSGGGLIDKPGKNPDGYHTCYALSGLSIAQHSPRRYRLHQQMANREDHVPLGIQIDIQTTAAVDVLGENFGNELCDIHPVHNITHDSYTYTVTYFNRIDQGCSASDADEQARAMMEECSLNLYNTDYQTGNTTKQMPDCDATNQYDHSAYLCTRP